MSDNISTVQPFNHSTSSDVVISVEGLWKEYRYGTISHASLRKDLQSWWARLLNRPDPNMPLSTFQPSTSFKHKYPSTNQQFNPSTDADDRFWALQDISFEVKQGEVLGIIGRNGAGKSTLLKIMSKVTTPTKGQIKIRGRIASLLEVGTGFHPELTGKENIFLNGAILGMTKEEIRKKFDEIVAFAEIEKFIDTPVKRYSSGMYVRLAFAVAAHLETEIMVVDEVLAVGDEVFQKKCLGKMEDIAQAGRTVLFVSHNMAAISRMTERCVVMDSGSISFNGATSESIEYYISKKNKVILTGLIPIEKVDYEYQGVSNSALRIVEIGFAENQQNEINIGDDLRLEVLVESSYAFKEVRFGYSINEEGSGCILTGFSPTFNIPSKGRNLVTLVIFDLKIAPGNYNLNISIGTGSLSQSKFDYHWILGFGRFCVKPCISKPPQFIDWHKKWGYVVHTNSQVIRNVQKI